MLDMAWFNHRAAGSHSSRDWGAKALCMVSGFRRRECQLFCFPSDGLPLTSKEWPKNFSPPGCPRNRHRTNSRTDLATRAARARPSAGSKLSRGAVANDSERPQVLGRRAMSMGRDCLKAIGRGRFNTYSVAAALGQCIPTLRKLDEDSSAWPNFQFSPRQRAGTRMGAL